MRKGRAREDFCEKKQEKKEERMSRGGGKTRRHEASAALGVELNSKFKFVSPLSKLAVTLNLPNTIYFNYFERALKDKLLT